MRVLFFTGLYPLPQCPQYGIFNHEMAKALKAAGVDVEVVVPVPFYRRGRYPREACLDGVRVRYMRCLSFGAAVQPWNAAPLFLALLWRVAFRRERFDLLHTHFTLNEGEATRLVSRWTGIPYVVHVHGLDAYGPAARPKKRTCARVYADAAAVICVSEAVKARLLAVQADLKRAATVYNGVDPERFHPAPSASKDSAFVVLSAGNLIELKGHRFVIDALAQLKAACPERSVRLRLLGSGPKRRELEDQARRLGIESLVEFAGYVGVDEVAAEMRQADCFVLPSYYEALGCVYLEAMASGLPIIACRGGGIEELVTDGREGLLVEPRDTDALVHAMLALAKDPALCGRMGAAGLERVRQGLTWQDAAARLRAVYEKIVGSG